MKDLKQLSYHPLTEQIVTILCKKTQNLNPGFFRILVNYHLTKIASMMRVGILTKDRGRIPVNVYAIDLGNSGIGKGHATNIIEDQVTHMFRNTFFDVTYPLVTEENLATLANRRAIIKGEDPDEMLRGVTKEFAMLGPLPFSFDSATTAAIKQMRHKLLMAGIGSMNLEIDEIGSNLLSNADVLGTYLELFDVGKLKQKLTKNTRENTRNEEIEGKTPTNLLLFGTPSKLLDGGKTEEEFYSFLETGYSRRSLFGYTKNGTKAEGLNAEQIYDILIDTSLDTDLQHIAEHLSDLANILNYEKQIIMPKDVSILSIKYRLFCEQRAADYGDHEDIRKAEMEHRYYKTSKLAGTYAFLDKNPEITEENFYQAIKLVEESGEAFEHLLKRERNYAKLAKYVASIHHEVTHVDLTEDLPFYRGGMAQKNELMQLAVAWGYKNQIVIKRATNNGIEFITGETLEKTDLKKMILSYSADIATGYQPSEVPFNKLHKLIAAPDLHWINHHVLDGYRSDSTIIPKFNLIVLDIDSGTTIESVRLLMKKYKYLLHTTKRHTPDNHRFRLILPINYNIALDSQDFKDFMHNINDWLPFEVDTATGQRSRKWLTCKGAHYEYNTGVQLLDALLFIPKTSKNDEQKKVIQSYQSLTNLERWFVQNMELGSRNNQLLKYALMLVDMGYDYASVESSITELNSKLEHKLSKNEIQSTILVTVNKKINNGGTKP